MCDDDDRTEEYIESLEELQETQGLLIDQLHKKTESLLRIIDLQEREIEWLRAIIRRADDHPLALVEGGTNGVDRLIRAVTRLSVANFYWDAPSTAYAFESIDAAVEFDDAGDVIELRPLHELPAIWVLVRRDGYSTHTTREAAEAAGEE